MKGALSAYSKSRTLASARDDDLDDVAQAASPFAPVSSRGERGPHVASSSRAAWPSSSERPPGRVPKTPSDARLSTVTSFGGAIGGVSGIPSDSGDEEEGPPLRNSPVHATAAGLHVVIDLDVRAPTVFPVNALLHLSL